MELKERLKTGLALMENIYDVVRLVDPVSRHSLCIRDNQKLNIEGSCYDYWKKGDACHNCISMRAYMENETFVKIEHKDGRVVLVTSTPTLIDETKYIIETLKDISGTGSVVDLNTNIDISIDAMIDEVNERIVRDTCYTEDRKMDKIAKSPGIGAASANDKLSLLNRRIEVIRDMLNEICATSEGKADYKRRLSVSQYLDELIVEYMKNAQRKEA